MGVWRSFGAGFVVVMVKYYHCVHNMAAANIFDELWGRLSARLDTTKPGTCWRWTGGKSGCGVHQYSIMKARPPGRETSLAINVHRIANMVKLQSWELPKGLAVSYLCHVNLCCIPDHLVFETRVLNCSRCRSMQAGRAVSWSWSLYIRRVCSNTSSVKYLYKTPKSALIYIFIYSKILHPIP